MSVSGTQPKGKPIEFEGLVDIRFADLDPYGHVNSKQYIDLWGSR